MHDDHANFARRIPHGKRRECIFIHNRARIPHGLVHCGIYACQSRRRNFARRIPHGERRECIFIHDRARIPHGLMHCGIYACQSRRRNFARRRSKGERRRECIFIHDRARIPHDLKYCGIYASDFTMFSVSVAITSSSFVGIMNTLTLEPGLEMHVGLRGRGMLRLSSTSKSTPR